MKDEKYTPEVGSWLKGREVPHPDSQQTARQVAARLPHIGQRGRWWPLPSFRRPPNTDQTTDYQPSPIPSANGHTPTVIGRTTSMLSPVKAITAGALVFAIGGAFLIAQPFEQQGGVPGAEAEPSRRRGSRHRPARLLRRDIGSGHRCHSQPQLRVQSAGKDLQRPTPHR